MTIGKYLPALLIVVLVGFLLARIDSPAPLEARTGPQTMKEVIGIVQKLGLHYRSDKEDGTVGSRLVVSESPLTWQRANVFPMIPKKDSDWNRRVAVLRSSIGVIELVPDEQMEVWGDFFVYGDSALIKRLTATETSKDRRP
jgi:hypothetical protein